MQTLKTEKLSKTYRLTHIYEQIIIIIHNCMTFTATFVVPAQRQLSFLDTVIVLFYFVLYTDISHLLNS